MRAGMQQPGRADRLNMRGTRDVKASVHAAQRLVVIENHHVVAYTNRELFPPFTLRVAACSEGRDLEISVGAIPVPRG
jgi:hypothetical protein